jgi:alpha-glucosidase
MRRSTHFPQFLVPDQTEAPAFVSVGRADVVRCGETAVRLRTSTATVEVTALAPDLFRVGMFEDGWPVSYRSEAVAMTDWPAHAVTLASDGTRVDTAQAAAMIHLEPLRISFVDQDRRGFAEDDPELGMGFVPIGAEVDPLGSPARVYKRHSASTHYFGCGERTGGLDKTSSHQVFWNFDPPVAHTSSLNNMYASVPFVLAIDKGHAWGMFVDSGYRLEFDLARESPERSGFGVDGGPLVYYVFAGPSPRQVIERFTELTGRIWIPPRWALGNHHSRWGYRTAEEVLSVARTFRKRGMPLDAIYVDIDYMNGYRVFTWDPNRFAHPERLAEQLHELGVNLVTIVDPGVKVDEDYNVYREARSNDLFCKTMSGDEYRNVVWPGMCAFPDFTNSRTRTWWGELQQQTLLDRGVAGIWNDMNEPTVFVPTPQTFPEDVTHQGDGEARLHIQVHNLYGQMMARASHEGMRRARPGRRPFVISRAGCAGLQRWALHWTGDNIAWWEHLWMSMPQLQNLGLSGYAWVGVDVGGYGGDSTGELLTRWMELGVFEPFLRNHSAWNTRPQEPWAFGEPYETLIRDLLLLRQRLVPYLYSLFEEASRTGAPILRPLVFEFSEDEETYSTDDEFLLGPALLVAPIARPGTEYRHVYLPRGTWVQYWTGERMTGPAHILAHAPLGRPSFYVRANTPIPMWPARQYDGEDDPDPLTWLVCTASADDGAFTLYEDAGEGYAYQQGEFSRVRATCRTGASGVVEVQLDEPSGLFATPRQRVQIDVRGVARPSAVLVNGQPSTDWQQEDMHLLVRLPASRAAQHIVIQG